jgi:hypothetical protein
MLEQDTGKRMRLWITASWDEGDLYPGRRDCNVLGKMGRQTRGGLDVLYGRIPGSITCARVAFSQLDAFNIQTGEEAEPI